MKIYRMNATFGKLEHETLTLEPGLNVIEAPNEWGKSTWCAFLLAMLYGIDTKERTTLTSLAAKERFAPWSGSPMSGRMDLSWNGKDITIERRTKGRAILGDFRAYETETGLDIPQLTAANCGEVLLGVEKEVFARAGFLKLADLPVTNDQALRRRLNALVTTGDESGTGDTLAQNLRDLRNKVRHNKTGLLPQAEAQREALNAKLRQIQDQKSLHEKLTHQLKELEQEERQLQNHAAALEYHANQAYVQRLEAAVDARETAENRVNYMERECSEYASMDEVENAIVNLQQLRVDRECLTEQLQQIPPLPEKPELPAFFQELDRESALIHVQTDYRVYQQSLKENRRRLPGILGPCGSIIAGIACLLIPHWIGIVLCALGFFAAFFIFRSNQVARKRAGETARVLVQKYAPHSPENWEASITQLLDAQQSFADAQQAQQTKRAILDAQLEDIDSTIAEFAGGESLAQCEQQWLFIREKLLELTDAQKELYRAQELEQALRSAHKDVQPPQFADMLTLSESQTQQRLDACRANIQRTHMRLGQVTGEMSTIGQEEHLRQQLSQLQLRIGKLEDTYAALTLAMDTLSVAASELQRKFSPRISKRAQDIFAQLTGGRYDRISLAEDLSISAGAQDEDTLHGSAWRSDGTIDQLYLALRLAVAEELTPNAPLVLDDALVRFDDVRLASAMDILKTYGKNKQVILFTCQSREKALL